VLCTLRTQSKENSTVRKQFDYRRSQEVGVESPPAVGRLGGVEPMTKPHFGKCGLLLIEEVMAFGNREFTSIVASQA
jgi:hypothetical protein